MSAGDAPYRPVLLVEDDEATAELERRVLQRSGLSVRSAASVSEALTALAQEPFLAVLLDYQLPDGDPWKVVDAAKAKTPPVPVILVTAMGNERVAIEALHHGVADYIKKSESFWETLPSTVERVVRLSEVEDKLHRTDALFQLIARHASDMIIVTKADGTILYVSPASRGLCGYEPAALIGRSFFDLVRPVDRERVIHSQQSLSLGQNVSDVFLCRRRDGGEIWVESSATMLPPTMGAQDSDIVRVTRDVSARKQHELYLSEQLNERDTLLREVHHRVKNNLQLIQRLLSAQQRVLEEGPTRTALHDTVQRIFAMALVHEKLYSSPNVSGVLLPEFVGDLLRHLMDASGAAARGMVLKTEIAAMYVDLGLAVPLGMLLTELVSNGIKHAFPQPGGQPEIRVTMHAQGAGALLDVSDNGVGLPAGLTPANSTSTGFSLAWSLAKQLGGNLEIRSDGGTHCRLLIARC